MARSKRTANFMPSSVQVKFQSGRIFLYDRRGPTSTPTSGSRRFPDVDVEVEEDGYRFRLEAEAGESCEGASLGGGQ